MAPEIYYAIHNKLTIIDQFDPHKIDVYSLACVIVELILLEKRGKREKEILNNPMY